MYNEAVLDKDVNKIIYGKDGTGSLYLGNKKSCADMNFLISAGIFAIISVTKTFYTKHPPTMIPYHMIIEAEDTSQFKLNLYFDEAADFINEHLTNGRGVLVHCEAGASRSPTIIMAYLIKFHNMTLEKALALLMSLRYQVKPNDGFLDQLEEYEKKFVKGDVEKDEKSE